MNYGKRIYKLIQLLWPLNRSLTGNDNRKTLKLLKNINPKLKIKEVKSGTKVFDWKIPNEWNVSDAYIKDLSSNKKIIDFKNNNLHLMGYSIPVKKKLNYIQLIKKLNYLKTNPKAIPYTTSYYKKDWGFNLSYNKFKSIKKNRNFEVKIKSSLKKGSMTYGELFFKGISRKEFIFSTYICHPSMANNELSGPALSIFLTKIFKKKKNYFSYRFLFIPETIGSISYISKNYLKIKKNVVGIINLTCVGDNKATSFLTTKYGNTFLDDLCIKLLRSKKIKFKIYNWNERGSDERQYMSALVNIPTISIMSSKFHTYNEYHTSKDNLKFINSDGLNKNYHIYKSLIEKLDEIKFPLSKIVCEPNLSKRNLYPSKSIFYKKNNKKKSKDLLTFLSFCDGTNTLENISRYSKLDINYIKNIYKQLLKLNLIKENTNA